MKPVCVKCQAEFSLKKSGVPVIVTRGTPPKGYSIWRADLLACPICSAEIVWYFTHEPIIERHEQGFEQELMAALGEDNRVVMYSPAHLVEVHTELKKVRRNGTH